MADNGNGFTINTKWLTLLIGGATAILGWTISIEVQRREDSRQISELRHTIDDMNNRGTRAGELIKQRMDQADDVIKAHRGLIITQVEQMNAISNRITALDVEVRRLNERMDKFASAMDSVYSQL